MDTSFCYGPTEEVSSPHTVSLPRSEKKKCSLVFGNDTYGCRDRGYIFRVALAESRIPTQSSVDRYAVIDR